MISKILLRFHHVDFPFFLKTIVNSNCFGPTEHKFEFSDPHPFQHLKNPNLPNITFQKNKYCLENMPGVFLYVLMYFGVFKSINKGSYGSQNPEIKEMKGLRVLT